MKQLLIVDINTMFLLFWGMTLSCGNQILTLQRNISAFIKGQ